MANKPPFGPRQNRQSNDYGLLKVRSMRIKQSEAVIKDSDALTNFNRMSHDKLIEICQGTDYTRMRELSKYFVKTNGMYGRAVRYLADLMRFDFLIYPNLDLDVEIQDDDAKKIEKKFNEVLEHFDNSSVQLMARRWAASVCIEGAYYGYVCDDISDKIVIQDLPINYCRSRFRHRGLPVIEFNVRYFDKITNSETQRKRLLSLFPDEFQTGYRKYKAGKLPAEDSSDDPGWIVLDLNRAFKFSFTDSDTDLPPFISAIPALIELEETQDLEKEKLLQQIQKILIQTFDLDKNGQLPFTMPELQRLNQNALDMVGDAVGVSVLSTVANVHMEEVGAADGNDAATVVDAAENNVYNDLGISNNLFNTEGNLSLEKSIIIDEAYVKPLLLQFEQFFNNYLEWRFNKKGLKFRLKMLTTSIFNYKDLSNSYKDLTKLGFSRFLPMVALGHSQKEVISLAKLEQQIMQLDAYMLPPFSSNTMSSDTWSDIKAQQELILGGRRNPNEGRTNQTPNADKQAAGTQSAAQEAASVGEGQAGRPELPDDQKSDKTIANRASQ